MRVNRLDINSGATVEQNINRSVSTVRSSYIGMKKHCFLYLAFFAIVLGRLAYANPEPEPEPEPEALGKHFIFL